MWEDCGQKHQWRFAQNIVPQFVIPQGVTEDTETKGFQPVSFRLLCPMNLVGGLIDKRGLIIRGIEYETGVFIDIGACVDGCKEHVITIAAKEVGA
jgi:poly(rC)-binding protein 3/4